jgi:hypothetical protein
LSPTQRSLNITNNFPFRLSYCCFLLFSKLNYLGEEGFSFCPPLQSL